jgi:hypothetical protein
MAEDIFTMLSEQKRLWGEWRKAMENRNGQLPTGTEYLLMQWSGREALNGEQWAYLLDWGKKQGVVA